MSDVLEQITIQEAIQMYQSQTALVDQIWQYFAMVTLAVLGFTIGSGKAIKSSGAIVLILGGYTAFAIGNIVSLRISHAYLVAFGDIVREGLTPANGPLTLPAPLSVVAVLVFYGFVFVFASAAVYKYWEALAGRPPAKTHNI